MKYDFDKVTDRYGTNSLKYDFKKERGMAEDILPLWVADMDFPVANEIISDLQKTIGHGIFGYSESKDSYFEAVQNWMKNNHNWNVKREWLVKTPGIVFALAMIVRALTDEGDSVIIQSPVYYPFSEVIKDNNRVLIENNLVEKQGKYTMDLQDLEKKIVESKAKLLLLCSPHNPVGRVWKKEELLALGEICLKHGVYIVSDEIHQDFVYKGNKHFVFSSLSKELEEISIVCTAPSKTFNLAGLQVSNIFIANEDIRNKFKSEIAKCGYSQLNTVGLSACESAYKNGREWLDQILEYLEGNLNFVRDFLEKRIENIKLIEPEGTYLVWLDCKKLGLNKDELEQLIINDAKLWLDGGYIFGETGSGFQRINIACPRSILKEALESLEKAVKKI